MNPPLDNQEFTDRTAESAGTGRAAPNFLD